MNLHPVRTCGHKGLFCHLSVYLCFSGHSVGSWRRWTQNIYRKLRVKRKSSQILLSTCYVPGIVLRSLPARVNVCMWGYVIIKLLFHKGKDWGTERWSATALSPTAGKRRVRAGAQAVHLRAHTLAPPTHFPLQWEDRVRAERALAVGANQAFSLPKCSPTQGACYRPNGPYTLQLDFGKYCLLNRTLF